MDDDQGNKVNSLVLMQTALFDSVVEAKNDVSPDNVNNKSSKIVDNDWLEDTKLQNSKVTSETINKDDGLFGEITYSSAASLPPPPLMDDPFNNMKSSVSEVDEQFKLAENNISSSDSQQAEQFELPFEARSGMSADIANERSSDSFDWFQDNLLQVNNDNNAKNKMVKEEVDSFDEWNDFASSAVNQDYSKNSLNQSGNDITASGHPKPEMDLLMSTDNFQEVDFSGFSQSDPFSASSSNAIGIGELIYIQPEVSTTNRTTDAAKVGKSSEQADISTEAHQKDDIEMLMSQMNDLSFMLETSISVPSKPDDFDSFLHN